MHVTRGALAPSTRAEFCRVLLILVVVPRNYSWACVVRCMRALVAVTTFVVFVDVDQGGSSPVSIIFYFVPVSPSYSPLGRSQHTQFTPSSFLPYSSLDSSLVYKVYRYMPSLDV